MAAAEELQPQQSMLEDASPTPTAAEHDAVSDGEPSDDGAVDDVGDAPRDGSSSSWGWLRSCGVCFRGC
jgi:hypothetical protein